MKKTILKSILVAFIATTSLISCSSDPINSNENDRALRTPPPGLAEFYFMEGGAFTWSTVSNPYAVNSLKTVIGNSGGSLNRIEIKLTSLAVGTYNVGTLNKLIYKKPFVASTWNGKSGKINITFNSAGVISGNYDISGTGIAGVSSVKGYFNNITINP
ncbi:MAG: hypothetical protein IPP30_02485 [Flavobacterium sp.]|nr:hypothetical protein [Flavobacterium sp.]